MDKKTEIITILQEECAELVVAGSKILRFGSPVNELDFIQEMADVLTLIHIAREEFNITEEDLKPRIDKKLSKLNVFSNIIDSEDDHA